MAGEFVVTLVVSDGQLTSAPDSVLITVSLPTGDAEIVGEIEEDTGDAEIIGEIEENTGDAEIIGEIDE